MTHCKNIENISLIFCQNKDMSRKYFKMQVIQHVQSARLLVKDDTLHETLEYSCFSTFTAWHSQMGLNYVKPSRKTGFISLYIFFFSSEFVQQFVRPCWIYGKIQTTFQIQYKRNYFPNSCIQCNLLITFLLQLEFIWGLGLRIQEWGTEDLAWAGLV